MSATLPPINHAAHVPQYAQKETNHGVEKAPGSPRRLAPLKMVCSKQEKDMMLKLQFLRQQQPLLTKPETSVYRNSYVHTLYLDMLQAGFHRSFSELFALTKRQNEERQRAGPESVLWNKVLLENEFEKLGMLKINLTKAEAASREHKAAVVYEAQFTLAKYFLSTGDKWLSDHFFAACLNTCVSAPGDTRKLAEAHCNMGLAVEEAGDRYAAAEHFEWFHRLASEGADWETDDGVTLHDHACTHLTRIYTRIADSLEAVNLAQFVDYLLKAHEMAKEGKNKKQEGEACYRLGLGYEKNQEYDKALHFLKRYFDLCKLLDDSHGLGLACEAIAKSYERQGKVDESIKYLTMFVEVAEKSSLETDVGRACSDLGAIFNSLSRYDEAAEYFTKAYNISRALNDKSAISSSRVQYGMAIAHKMLSNVSVHIEREDRPCAKRLLDWKSARSDSFDKDIPRTDEHAASRQASGTSAASSAPPKTLSPAESSTSPTLVPPAVPSVSPTQAPPATTPSPTPTSP